MKVKLIDYLDESTNAKAKDIFLRKISQTGANVKQTKYTDNLTIYSINKVSQATMDSLATMDGVLTVKALPHYEIEVAPDPYLTEIDVVSPRDGEQYPVVGLLDSGVDVADTPHLQPWIEEDNTAGLAEFDIDRKHGTAVAGILMYGDALEGKKLTGTGPFHAKSFIVNTSSDKTAIIEEPEMVEYIKDAISTNPDIKVWNLSQGSKHEVSDNEFSDFAIVLDDLQKKYNVLICKSAGNIHPATPHEMRITHGADSLLSIVVGSIAHIKQREDDAEPGYRSPFSRIGLGPCNTVKPDVVHYGGNKSIGVNSFAITGFQTSCHIQGTSFSTPRVTALAASLAHRLGTPFRSDVVKAMILHHAEYSTQENIDANTLAKEYGVGLPKDIDTMLTNNPDEFTMIWPMELTKEAEVRILDFPFPESLVDNEGFFYGEITLTMACTPSLKATENSEYCQSSLDIKLQTYDHVDSYILGAAGTPERFRNEHRSIDAQNILTSSRYSTPSFKSLGYADKTIIPDNKDFQPSLKFHVNLEKNDKV